MLCHQSCIAPPQADLVALQRKIDAQQDVVFDEADEPPRRPDPPRVAPAASTGSDPAIMSSATAAAHCSTSALAASSALMAAVHSPVGRPVGVK